MSSNGDSSTERELMREGLRWTTILVTGWLTLLPAQAGAQNTAESANVTTPATDAIGPRELQNFSLPGTKTQPAPQSPAEPAEVPAARPVEAAGGVVTARQPKPEPRASKNRPAIRNAWIP